MKQSNVSRWLCVNADIENHLPVPLSRRAVQRICRYPVKVHGQTVAMPSSLRRVKCKDGKYHHARHITVNGLMKYLVAINCDIRLKRSTLDRLVSEGVWPLRSKSDIAKAKEDLGLESLRYRNLWKWSRVGLKFPSGVLKLENFRMNGLYYTTHQALMRFAIAAVEKTNPGAFDASASVPAPSESCLMEDEEEYE